MSGTVTGLRCRECHREYPIRPIYVCEYCFGPLEVVYDYAEIKRQASRKQIEAGPCSLWRYLPFLPVEGKDLVDLQTGFTPLLKAKRLGEALGLKTLYIKNDSVNPTWSFKDRVVSVALTKAREFKFDTVACASTGNLANATAAHAAHAGFNCYIFIPYDLEQGKVVNTLIYKPTLVKVEGNYDDVNRLCAEIAGKYPWAFVNVNIRPFYAEGSKTLGFETAEQLGWRAPDHVVVPVASGSLLTKIHKGFQEFWKTGLIPEPKTRVSAAQAEGCSPVVDLVNQKTNFIVPVKPKTIAKSLAIGNPADGFYAAKVVEETGGHGEKVNDEEIVNGIKLLAETEGIFTETAGGVVIGVLKKLAQSGRIKKEELTVAYITGNGLKTQEAIIPYIEKPYQIKANLKAFEKILKGEETHGH